MVMAGDRSGAAMKCERCGGPAPVEGETYRHYWPCGCAVTPDRVYSECYRETIWYSHGLGIWQSHPTREGAIAAWRAALGPYQAPRVDTDPRPPPSAGHYALLLWERRQREHISSRKPSRSATPSASASTMVELNRAEPPMLTREAPKPELSAKWTATPHSKCPCQCGGWAGLWYFDGLLDGVCHCGRSWTVKT